jgi:hypothetical protein
MKNEPIHYLGLDVHQSTTVACVRDEQSSVRMRATVPTEKKAIVQLATSAGWRVHVAFEEGTQAQWLHEVLIERVERVVVFNARGRGAKDNKDDRIDAEAAAERLRTGALKPVFHGAPEMLTLRELVRSYENLVQDATRVMLRVKAMFRARGIATPGVSVYRPSQRKTCLQKQRSSKQPMTRGLNRNHHPTLKAVFKGAANDAVSRPGPLHDCYEASVARGVDKELAKVTLARKIAAVMLQLWKRGERFDPAKLMMQAT